MLDRLDSEGKQAEIDRILADAPKAIPGPLMRTLWRLLLSKRLKSLGHHADLYDWLRRFGRDGLTPSLRMELREILAPRVTLRAPFRWGEDSPRSSVPTCIRDLVDWELVLASDHVHSTLRDQGNKPQWQAVLPDLLQDFSILLRDAFDLRHELGGAEERNDSSYVYQPSIGEHAQNKDFDDWTILIELARDAWLATAHTDLAQAQRAAEDWWQVPYPIFKRLALFAAAQDNAISQRRALGWLLDENGWWLWSVETQREALRLMVTLAPSLDAPELDELEDAILEGPPRKMFKADIEKADWAANVDWRTWLRLAKVQATGVVLGQVANTKLDELTQKYPRWQLAKDERDEFSFWMGRGDEMRVFSRTPRRRRELVEWLKEHRYSDDWTEDDWLQRCRDDFPTTACALCGLAKEGIWLEGRWRAALQAWSEDKFIKRSWRYMGPVLNDAPDEFVQSLARGLSWWLQSVAKTIEDHETFFLTLCRRILAVEHSGGEDTTDPVGRAINHPVGQTTEALFRWWYRRSPEDEQGLPAELKPIFTELCKTEIDKFRHGRVLLAAHVIALYRVDRVWATEYLLPLFDWQCSSVEARWAWEGFLWSPRLYRPLLTAFKTSLLETAAHYDELGDHAEQYAAFLTFAALDPGDTFTTKELTATTVLLPAEGLERAAQALTSALESAGHQRGDYWNNRLLPYLRNIWPKSRDLITPRLSEKLASLCVAAGEMFPDALSELLHWLVPVQYPHYVVHLIHLAKLCAQFPADALAFLDAVIGNDAQMLPRELQQCLNDIEQSNPQLANDPRFIRLAELIRRRGMA